MAVTVTTGRYSDNSPQCKEVFELASTIRVSDGHLTVASGRSSTDAIYGIFAAGSWISAHLDDAQEVIVDTR